MFGLKSKNLIIFLAVAALLSPSMLEADDSREMFFERRIRPVLVTHCYECHSAASPKAEGGLVLDHRGGLLRGGESGPGIVPGKPDQSLLLDALRHESFEMPPAGKLPDQVIKDFEKWISAGAVDPRDHSPSPADAAAEAWKAQLRSRSRWWSLQPPTSTPPPECEDKAWGAEPVDRFVYASLKSAGLVPATPANPDLLLRRLSFVLTGLPPTPRQIESFRQRVAEDFDAAVDTAVNDLLASPHFGERFARHWMDVVRYTDTYGYEWDIPAKGSWEYRDYLIRAFNDDVGFDQLIREQLAGDLLKPPRINEAAGLNESMIGPMFFHMGEHRHGSSLAFNGIHQEMIDNKIDAFSKAFLGMTVACARCHNHKLDAVSQADYYALAGMFMTPRWTARPIEAPGKHDAQVATLKKLRSDIRSQLADSWRSHPGPLVSGDALRTWAVNQKTLEKAQPHDISHPFHQLLKETGVLPIEGVSAEATNASTRLAIDAENVILAEGPIPETDSYTVKFATEAGRASRVRLEALTHASLGSRGPGRTSHGNFVLSQIHVRVQARTSDGAGLAPPRSVTLQSARADYSQPNYPVEAALNSQVKGWGVGLGGNVDRTAWFEFAEAIELPKGGEWSIRLDFSHGTKHVLGCFRISVGADKPAKGGPGASDHRAIVETWRQLSSDWRAMREQRRNSNAKFRTLADFSRPGFPPGWITDGEGMRHGYVAAAAPRIRLEGSRVVADILEAGYHTHSLSPKLHGALRLPAPELFPQQQVILKLAGGEWAGRREIPQNAFLNEGPVFFDAAAPPTWTAVAKANLSNGVTRVLTEISTASLNSNFPPRTSVARAGNTRLPDDDEGYDKLSWFSVTGIVSSDGGGGPADELNEFAEIYEGPPPADADACWQRLQAWLVGVIDRWGDGKSQPGDVKILNWMLQHELVPNDTATVPEIAGLLQKYREAEASIALPRSVNSMDERGVRPIDYRLNIRGDVHQEGPAVPRGFLEAFGKPWSDPAGSGRLELAQYLSSRHNPQTARVYVNRVWQWVFGAGIVATPNDFGKLGDQPSHPELLDWLALKFMDEGWSTKKLVRRLVLSRTFRQGGTLPPFAAERDPENRLLHHYPTRRLEAEAIRDSLLAASGELDHRLYGRPINPPRSTEDAKKRLYSGPLDSDGRRSLYIEMSIMDPPKFLVGFNLPDLKLPTGRRDETNVPAQALILLNDPLVVSLADRWGERLVKDDSVDPQHRVRSMFVTAFGRTPTAEEAARWVKAVEQFSKSDDLMRDQTAWAELAHVIFNTKEFLYYR